VSQSPSAVETRRPARAPNLDRDASAALAGEELARFGRQLDTLEPAEGSRPSCCPGWDVRDIASHVLGMAQMFSSYPQMARQHLAAARAVKGGAGYLDALTARQVADRKALDLAEIRSQLADVAPRNVRWRRRAPGVLRRQRMSDLQPVNGAPGAALEACTAPTSPPRPGTRSS
jgi:uncharacterized protein (TIGR03083 family)